ncbi:MAG: DUF87 domain-containing protein [bacterium]|nr:DUF87 domain-containing protein [bacterium]
MREGIGMEGLYLGVDLESKQRTQLDEDHLTTHAVCLGMTGSGKTGLGIVAMEELARRGVPLLVIDLKGDMVNLLLNFPELRATDLAPWLPPDAVEDRNRVEVATEQADLWRGGLSRSGLGPDDAAAVRDGVQWQLITPGIGSGAPLDILPTLSAPEGWDIAGDPDGASDRVNGVVSGLLSLIGRGGDPLTDRDHVLLASIILEHWRRGDRIDLVGLLRSLAQPPFENLGVLPLESFYPRDDRMKLVMELNTLLASPAFASWTRGIPLTMEALLGSQDKPRGTVVSVAHLDQRQRLFILSLIVSELVSWMRRQSGSSGLRALLYIDEVQGILPPYPASPPTKGPLLTLLKQGRAFGVGAWLATQNPVDLDYKALGNAGVKLIGRLITDRDRERALEGLGVNNLPDGRDPDEVVAGLGKREFLLYDVRAKQRTRTFSSRWAMSYLRGPVTVSEMKPLFAASDTPSIDSDIRQVTEGRASEPPVLSSSVAVRFSAVGSEEASPGMVVRSRLDLERRTINLSCRDDEVWHVRIGTGGVLDWEGAELLSEMPDLSDQPPRGMEFPVAVPGGLDRSLAKFENSFVAWRARRPVSVMVHKSLKLCAEPKEEREAFLERCLVAADRADDTAQERARKRFEKRMETLRRRLAREEDELERDRDQLGSRRTEEKLGVVEGLFSVLLGSRSLRSAAGKAASKARGAATKRRMRQRAESSVVESEREIDRLEEEIEDLALELQDEVDRIAAESEAKAENIEDVDVRPQRKDVTVLSFELVWE